MCKYLLLSLILFSSTIGIAQQNQAEQGKWQSFARKMTVFANLKDNDFAKYASTKKHKWKKAFIFDDALELFPEAEFLYGYTNTRMEYIEVILKNISNRRGTENKLETQEDLQEIERILNEVVDPALKKFGNADVRKECLICSDSTLVLWKTTGEAGSKFLEKRFVSFEYYKAEGGRVEITFYNNRKEIPDFFTNPSKRNTPTVATGDRKKSSTASAGIVMINALDTKESEFVFHSLKTMRMENASSSTMKATIHPTFLATHNLSDKEYWINGYRGLVGFKITEQSENAVTAYVWGKNKMWIHKLIFKVLEYEGKLYLEPKGVNTDNYIDPWNEIEPFVKVGEGILE